MSSEASSALTLIDCPGCDARFEAYRGYSLVVHIQSEHPEIVRSEPLGDEGLVIPGEE